MVKLEAHSSVSIQIAALRNPASGLYDPKRYARAQIKTAHFDPVVAASIHKGLYPIVIALRANLATAVLMILPYYVS